MSTTISNVKIPYPTEGVIRTAQLDDPVTPANSAQLAVNMNFDRIGAVATRPGVTQYATVLGEAIKNYGTLNNFTVPAGFNRIIQVGSEGTLATNAISYMASVKVDATHMLTFWKTASNTGIAQVMQFVEGAIDMVPVGTPLTFEATANSFNSCIALDASHFMNVWTSTTGDAIARVFFVDGAYNVSFAAAAFTFDSGDCSDFTISVINSTHVIVFYSESVKGWAVVLAINTGTWVVTKPGSALNFDAVFATGNSCAAIGDGIHFTNFWSRGLCQTFAVNTGTWAITALLSPLSYDATSQNNQVLSLGDGIHFINFWLGFQGGGQHGIAQVFTVNPTTFVMGTAATYTYFSTYTGGSGLYNSAVSMGDGEHFVNYWIENNKLGYAQIFDVNPSTYVVTRIGQPDNFGTVSTTPWFSAVALSSSRIGAVWQYNSVGYGGLFRLDGLPVYANYLYAQHGSVVDNWNGSAWTTRRSGLASGQGKARFSQFLNREWMVNGNATIGDAVQTSNGGAFDSTLVPDGFPAGDFIQAGFEGRVWVADALYGVLYYTDIVQFSPPDIYTLTYDPNVNFISEITPQSGENITGLFEVPRALLVFTENTITRVYGATSLDAYPAYNVGTYSQESIVQTKTGIFFHHSSGIYQFDYGGQPVEISRRIIDFIQAIPRAYYPKVTGVWDGFDNVEWSIGPITVDNISFANCVIRYTISTQVWTIYDYVANTITAMIAYDDGTTLNHLMGTAEGKTGALDTGLTDFGTPFYYEYIDRWRSYFDMYAEQKSISGVNVFAENAGGANLYFQSQGDGPNVMDQVGTLDENIQALFPNYNSEEDFSAGRWRIAGTTRGSQVIIHGIEVLTIMNKGLNSN